MKAPILAALLAGAGAGAGTAALSITLLSDKTDTPLEALDPADDMDVVFEELSKLREQNASLVDRIGSLENRSAMATPTRTPVEVDNLDLDELRDLLASFQASDQPPPPQFQDMVERALQAKEDRDQATRDEQRRQEREDRMDERMNTLAQELGLDVGQTKGVRDVLTNRDLQREELWASMRDGGGFGAGREGMRETMKEMSDATNTQLQQIMSTVQYEQYTEMEGDRGGFGGRGGGRRGGGD